MTATKAPLDTCLVTFDRDRSTKFTEVYPVPSRSQPGTVWLVTYDVGRQRWRCPCPATVAACAHVCAAQDLRMLRWWRAYWADTSDEALWEADRTYLRRAQEEDMSGEGRWAFDTLGDEVGCRMADKEAG